MIPTLGAMPRAKFSSQALKSATNSPLSIGYVLFANSKVDIIPAFPASVAYPGVTIDFKVSIIDSVPHLDEALRQPARYAMPRYRLSPRETHTYCCSYAS
jgi:hypothetical protein